MLLLRKSRIEFDQFCRRISLIHKISIFVFSQLPAHAPTYFVTGNHEYYYGDVQEWIRFYKNGRINVLENE